MNKSTKTKIIAFYLPQYHPIKENNEWWGEGFTEWTNVRKAKVLFPGHKQPKVPTELGYYNLLDPDIRAVQADLARKAGVDGFCYWHYWFGNGKRLLERPFNEVLTSGSPDFPFCLGWANHSWKAKNWNSSHRGQDKLLIEQTYPGEEDYINHFNLLLTAFKDNRYIKVDGKPLLLIWDAENIPNFEALRELWNRLAMEHGIPGIHFVSYCTNPAQADQRIKDGYAAAVLDLMFDSYWNTNNYKLQKYFYFIYNKIFRNNPFPRRIHYKSYAKHLVTEMGKTLGYRYIYPCVLPNYDHTPRSGRNGYVLTHSTPQSFGTLLSQLSQNSHLNDDGILFVKSWNEWGEGNYLEPDQEYGHGFLEAIRHNK